VTEVGDAYQEVVGAVERALNPGATVTVSGWIAAPDRQRDMDVAVQGLVDGRPHVVLIACQDQQHPVGIGSIDRVEAKRRDFGADAAILYSTSGFTRDALLQARRVGIEPVAAVVAGDGRIRVVVYQTIVAKSLALDRWNCTVYAGEGAYFPALEGFDRRR
jgi:hypothetical protein